MLTAIATTQPQLTLVFAGVLFFGGGRLVRSPSCWRVLSLCALAAAGWLLWNPSGPISAAPSETLRTPLGGAVGWTTLAAGFLFVLAAWQTRGVRERAPEFLGCLLLGLGGTMLVAAADDLLVLVLSLELVYLTAGLLVILSADRALAAEAGFKAIFLGALASALLLFGTAAVFGLTGDTQLQVVREALHANLTSAHAETNGSPAPPLVLAALVLMSSGLAMRLTAVPFHFGQAEILETTDAWTSGWLCIVPRLAAVVAAFRLWNETLAELEPAGVWLVLVLSAGTLIVAGSGARRANSLRRLTAYSAMAHVGFVLVGMGTDIARAAAPAPQPTMFAVPGVAAAAFLLAADALALCGLTAVLVLVAWRDRPLAQADDLAGLVRAQPLAAGCALVCLLSLAGVPPLPGFWGRLLVVSAALSGPAPFSAEGSVHAGFWVLAAIALGSVWFLGAAYFRILQTMFLEPPVGRQQAPGGRTAQAAALLAAAGVVLLGLLPNAVFTRLVDVFEHGDRAAGRMAVAQSRVLADNRPRVRRGAAIQKRPAACAAVDFRAQSLRANAQCPQQLPREQPAAELEFAAAMRAVNAGRNSGQNAIHQRPVLSLDLK